MSNLNNNFVFREFYDLNEENIPRRHIFSYKVYLELQKRYPVMEAILGGAIPQEELESYSKIVIDNEEISDLNLGFNYLIKGDRLDFLSVSVYPFGSILQVKL